MIVSTENPKGSTQKPQDLTTEFSRAAEHKINIQKLAASHCTNNEVSEREYKTKKKKKKNLLKLHQNKKSAPKPRNKPDEGCKRFIH